jgi:hypothetical protein
MNVRTNLHTPRYKTAFFSAKEGLENSPAENIIIIIIIIIIIKRVEEKRREWLVLNYFPAEMAWVDTRYRR